MKNLSQAVLGLVVSGLFQEAGAASTNGGAAAKTPKFSKREYDLDAGTAHFSFGNGKELVVSLEEIPAELHKRLALHGIIQKVGDSYASAKGNFGVAIESAQGVIDQLKAGEWTGGGDEARPRLAELAAAIARIKGKNDEAGLAAVMTAVEKATDEQRKQWRSNAQVKATIAQIRAEKAQAALEGAGTTEEVKIDV